MEESDGTQVAGPLPSLQGIATALGIGRRAVLRYLTADKDVVNRRITEQGRITDPDGPAIDPASGKKF